MNRPLFTSKRLLMIVVAILSLSSLLPKKWLKPIVEGPRNLILHLLSPATVRLHSLSTALGPPERRLNVGQDQDLGQHYANAKIMIEQLEHEVSQLKDLISQLRQAEQAVGRKTSLVLAPVTASVRDARGPLLVIDRGADADPGIRGGLTVVYGINLVGKVATSPAVSRVNAHVRVLTHPGSKLRVRITTPVPPSTPRTVEDEIVFDPDAGAFIVTCSQSAPVKTGDWAHLSDPDWPREAQGLLVGQVDDVVPDPDDPLNFKRVLILPVLRLELLRSVTVLVPD